jgi:hypothetical protein
MRFAEGQYREMASPLSRWGWKGSKPRLTPTSRPLPWAGAASRRFVANMGAGRPSLPAGFKSAPALQAALQQVKFKFRRLKPPTSLGDGLSSPRRTTRNRRHPGRRTSVDRRCVVLHP